MVLVLPDFLKEVSLEQGSEGGDMAWIAREERNPVQVCGPVRLWVGLWWAAIKALCTWTLSRQLLWLLEKWVNIMQFERLHSDFWAIGSGESQKQGGC